MNERFELSFKNIEVRVRFYIMLPAAIAAILVLFFAEYQYRYVSFLLILGGWIAFYSWRFLYKKKANSHKRLE